MVVGVRTAARSLLVWLRRRWLLVASMAIVGWLGCGFAAAWSSTRPWPSAIAPRTRLAGCLVQEVATTTADGLTVRGWLVRAAAERGCVVLAAGIRGNRTAMVSRAECYLERGWSTLLVDLRGTGASDSSRAGGTLGLLRDMVLSLVPEDVEKPYRDLLAGVQKLLPSDEEMEGMFGVGATTLRADDDGVSLQTAWEMPSP